MIDGDGAPRISKLRFILIRMKQANKTSYFLEKLEATKHIRYCGPTPVSEILMKIYTKHIDFLKSSKLINVSLPQNPENPAWPARASRK